MNIAVMSPHTHKSGNTVIASLIAYELSTRNRTVCLTHGSNKSNSLYQYFNMNEKDNQTCNSTQLLDLIKEGGIRKNDIGNYCRSITDRFELFSLNSNEVSSDKFNSLITFINSNFPHDYIIYDIDDNDLESTINQAILKECDCIIYILTQNSTELSEFNENKKQILYWMEDIPSIVVVNKYCDIVSNIKQVAAGIGIKKVSKWYKLSYNPWITYGTANGKMKFLYENIQKREYHVVDIDSDVKALVNGILSIKHAKQVARYHTAPKNKEEIVLE